MNLIPYDFIITIIKLGTVLIMIGGILTAMISGRISVLFISVITSSILYQSTRVFFPEIKNELESTQQISKDLTIEQIKEKIRKINKKILNNKNLTNEEVLTLQKERLQWYKKLLIKEKNKYEQKIKEANKLIKETSDQISKIKNTINDNKILLIKEKNLKILETAKNLYQSHLNEVLKQINNVNTKIEKINIYLSTTNENKKINEFVSDIAKMKNENIKNIDTKETFKRFVDSINNEVNKINSVIQINKEINEIKK